MQGSVQGSRQGSVVYSVVSSAVGSELSIQQEVRGQTFRDRGRSWGISSWQSKKNRRIILLLVGASVFCKLFVGSGVLAGAVTGSAKCLRSASDVGTNRIEILSPRSNRNRTVGAIQSCWKNQSISLTFKSNLPYQ